jgi:outer membrane protein OmpA-like peptidoglycan-associated protein
MAVSGVVAREAPMNVARTVFFVVVCFAAAGDGALAQSSFEIQTPSGSWQVPGEIQVPTGPWQEPGDIQIPKGIQAVKSVEESACLRRITVVGDALFDFDKSDLRPDAEETLVAAGPEIAKAGTGKLTITGHTDSKGSDAYNDQLSEARARTVRDWLVGKGIIPAETAFAGRGERQPIASNENADGSDNPEGRQQNRRVEVEIDSCG